jgi:hypothetical protein
MVAAADKAREAVVQVQDLVLSRNPTDGQHYIDRDRGTESGQFADVHGTIRIPDTERVRMVLRIEIEGGIA